MSILGKRLKDARLKKGLSQEQVGLRAGLEVESASARMNRYERGTRVPSVELVERIAEVLDVPLTYFYAAEEDEAKLVVLFYRMSSNNKNKILDVAETFSTSEEAGHGR
ncbi:helix-turn-helix domain-containing protein [Duganella sp. Dugasp56]|uniref:helix-turn-helix domain-containing protein n=1 Tax=Duganella sp. Dugasp56 TaxID=3243046 RepID=UPI0039AFFE1B